MGSTGRRRRTPGGAHRRGAQPIFLQRGSWLPEQPGLHSQGVTRTAGLGDRTMFKAPVYGRRGKEGGAGSPRCSSTARSTSPRCGRSRLPRESASGDCGHEDAQHGLGRQQRRRQKGTGRARQGRPAHRSGAAGFGWASRRAELKQDIPKKVRWLAPFGLQRVLRTAPSSWSSRSVSTRRRRSACELLRGCSRRERARPDCGAQPVYLSARNIRVWRFAS